MASHGLDVADDLLLDQVEAHGQQCDAEQQIQRTKPYAQVGVIALVHSTLRGHEVAEPDGGERDKTKVRRVREFPVLPASEQERSHYDVADHQQHAQPDRDRFYMVRVVVIEVVRVVSVIVVVAVPRGSSGILTVHGETQWRHDARTGRHYLFHFKSFVCEKFNNFFFQFY